MINNIVTTRGVVPINGTSPSNPVIYPMNDLNSVYTHWDNELKCNVTTENKIDGGVSDGKNSK
jgi:hypothetical protein